MKYWRLTILSLVVVIAATLVALLAVTVVNDIQEKNRETHIAQQAVMDRNNTATRATTIVDSLQKQIKVLINRSQKAIQQRAELSQQVRDLELQLAAAGVTNGSNGH